MIASLDPATLARLADEADTGGLRVSIDSVYPLENATAALDHFAVGKHGKIARSVNDV